MTLQHDKSSFEMHVTDKNHIGRIVGFKNCVNCHYNYYCVMHIMFKVYNFIIKVGLLVS